MSIVESFEVTPTYTVSGPGPYRVSHGFMAADELVVSVSDGSNLITLPASDYSVDPASSYVAGDLTLTVDAAATYNGWTLYIDRDTDIAQGWAAAETAREKGIANQLARLIMVDQDLRRFIGNALRTLPQDGPIQPISSRPADRAGRLIVWNDDGTAIVESVRGDDLAEVAENATAAAASAAAASTSSTEATESATAAATSAAAVVADRKSRSFDAIQDSIYRIRDHQLAFFSRLDAGQIATAYPGVYDGPVFTRPVEDAAYIAKRDIVINRLLQMAAVSWTPQVDMPGEEQPTGVQFPAGVPVQGPPYSSVKTLGRTIGNDISLETFVTAADNDDGDFYNDFSDLPNWPGEKDAEGNIIERRGVGVLLHGAVCSNFIGYGYDWFYSPVTGHLDTDYRRYGFVAKQGTMSFDSSHLRIGDVLNSVGGGHIEIVIDRDDVAKTITLFDQDRDGPQPTVYSTDASGGVDEMTEYVRRRGYAQLIYDFNNVTHSYTPDPFAPLPGESLPAPVFPNFVKLNKGNKSNYAPGETVRFNLSSDTMDSLVVSTPDGLVTISTSGDEILTEAYTTPGSYVAQCYNSGSPVGVQVQFEVASITAAISSTTVAAGGTVTVTFSGENCVPNALLIETATTLSITPGILREITPEEVAAGELSFEADLSKRGWHVRIRGTNAFGAVFNEPIDGLYFDVE